MVLYPLSQVSGSAQTPSNHSQAVPAWDAVERKQKESASEWWLIAQPDHAMLAGDLSARMQSPLFSVIPDEVVKAIALHDEGWRPVDSGEPRQDKGRPLSFL